MTGVEKEALWHVEHYPGCARQRGPERPVDHRFQAGGTGHDPQPTRTVHPLRPLGGDRRAAGPSAPVENGFVLLLAAPTQGKPALLRALQTAFTGRPLTPALGRVVS